MKWNDIVGQEKGKNKIEFYFDAYNAGEPFPNLMLCGQKGNGKTAIMQSATLKLTELSGGVKRGMLINASAVKNLKQFWNSVVIPVVNDKDVTLCVDEASELPTDVTMALLTMINPNKENKNTFVYDDYSVDIDMRRQTFLFATTEPQSVFHALMNRCTRVDLEPYSTEDLAKILKKHAPKVSFERGVLEALTPTLRGNARITVLTARNILSYLAPLRKTDFNLKDWDKFSKRLDVLPLGLSRNEVAVLRIIGSRKDSSLTRLAASLGMTPQAVRQDCELYLLSQGLMEITTGGRNITPRGQEILAAVEKTK